MNVNALGWTLLHFLWQGALVGAAVALVLRGMTRSTPAARYGVSVLALASMAALPLATFAMLAEDRATPISPHLVESLDRGALVQAEGTTLEPAVGSSDTRVSGSTLNAGGATPATRWRAWGNAAAPYLVQTWLAGVFLFAVRLIGGWFGVRRLTRAGVREPGELIRERLDAMAARVRVSRPVRVLESTLVRTPAAIGFLRPVILWPVSLQSGLTVAQIDLLLTHELAHLRRHDYLVNLLQSLVETALFYQPAVWWLSSRIREEREHCCDDIALEASGDRAHARAYADALMALAAWRQGAPVLAPAATGGNLLRRIQRLLAGNAEDVAAQPESIARPRWTAVPVAVAAALGILIQVASAPETTAQVSINSDEKTKLSGAVAPSSVSRYEGAGKLSERVEWARGAAAAASKEAYSVGYAIDGDPSGMLVYFDRRVPVSFSRNTILTGHLHFRAGDQVRVEGVPPSTVLGSLPPAETVVLLGFKRGALDRVHVSSAALPIHFDGRPFYWLDAATDEESLSLSRDLFAKAAAPLLQDLVALAALHADQKQASTTLQGWFAATANERLRVEIVEALGPMNAPDALPFLERVARGKDARKVRQEAAEAIGEQPTAAAPRVLGALARDIADPEVAQEATEALGEREEPEALDELVKLAWDEGLERVRREAVEAMGESRDERRITELKRIAITHALEDMRVEAIETLGGLEGGDPARVREILEAAIAKDASKDVREEAIDALGEMGDPEAIKILSKIAAANGELEARRRSVETLWEKNAHDQALAVIDAMTKSSDPRIVRQGIEVLGGLESDQAISRLAGIARLDVRPEIQRAAAEALGSAAPVAEAFEALKRIAAENPNESVQRQAIESMGDLETDGVIDALEGIARTHPSERIRAQAIEAVGNHDDTAARKALERLAEQSPSENTQAKAIEAMADDHASPETAAWLARRVLDASATPRIQQAALDALEGMDENGIEAIINVSRSAKNPELRRRAVEILAESDDPRARKELVRILER